jgi:uncharacterized lipoprotein YajG
VLTQKYSDTIFILAILGCCLFSGCSSVARLHYTPSWKLNTNIGNGRSLQLNVVDERVNKKITRSNSGFSVRLEQSPVPIVAAALHKALMTSGFDVYRNSQIQYNVTIQEFYVEWQSGLGVPVTAVITLHVDLKTSDGQMLAQKRVSDEVTEFASGGGYPAKTVANRVLQKCLTKIVENAVQEPTLITTINNFGSNHMASKNFIDDAKPKQKEIAVPYTHSATVLPMLKPLLMSSFPHSKKWAVIVGISQYLHFGKNGLTNLIFADDDAKAFANTLRNLGWSESHMKILINEKATERNLKIALKSWLTKAGSDDQVILFWAGHGYPDPEDPEKVYLATYDTDISIPVTGYRMDEVREALEEIGSKNVILLADTCHAGKLITRGDGGRGISIIPNINKMTREQRVPKGWVFMVGADTDRQAIEHTSWANGAFTHSLIKGLNGEADGFQSAGAKDGIVTMGGCCKASCHYNQHR